MMQMTTTAINLVLPGLGIYKSLSTVEGHKCNAIVMAILAQTLWLAWFILHIVEVSSSDSGSMAWVCFCFFSAAVGYTRYTMRVKYNVWGSLLEDMWLGVSTYPFVITQSQLMAANDGEGAPAYFADVVRSLELHKNAGVASSSTGVELKGVEARA